MSGSGADDVDQLLDEAESNGQAFDKLFARYRDYLRQVVAFRLDPAIRSRVEASDIIQEAHMEAARRMPEYLKDRQIPFRLWLRQIAFDRPIMARRRHVDAACRSVDREVPLPDGSSLLLVRSLAGRDTSPIDQAAEQEAKSQLQTAIAQLNENDREILLMLNFEGLTSMEAAQVLDIEPATARKRHGRALLRLRQRLVDLGFQETSE